MKLAEPLFLLALLPAVAALALAWRAARAGNRLALALRAAAASLLALAAASLLVRAPGRPKALVILDRSASMTPARAEAAAAAKACGRALAGRFDAGFASFAATARPEGDGPGGLEALEPDAAGTDPAAALRLAGETLRSGEPAVVVTDGRWTVFNRQPATGNQQPALVFLPAGPASPDAALAELDAPSEVRPGEKFAVVARVSGSASAPVTVTLSRSPQAPEPRTQAVNLPPRGEAVRACAFEDVAPERGLLEYTATLSAPGDALAANNSARALVRVTAPLRVGVIARGKSPAAAALQAAGLDAEVLAPGALPASLAGFDALILDNVPRSALPDEAVSRLAGFASAGGGLLALGGPDAFGAGGWEDSGALEKALPVSMRPPGETLFVVLVLDRSGSMGQPAAGGESKLSLVKQAALAALDTFREKDRLAVVAFADAPETVAGPAEVAGAAAAARFRAAVTGLSAGGSTHLADALAAAARLVTERAGAREVRHVLLLSDGLPEGVDRAEEERRLQAIAESLSAAGATVSTVGTGTNDQDLRLLEKIGREWGRGRAYQPRDLASLVSIFRSDLNLGELVSKSRFVPAPTADPLAASFGALPELAGRNRVSAKPRARAVLEAPAAAGRGREPLVAVWDFGRGRAASFASEFGREWGAALDGGKFLAPLVRWTAGRTAVVGCRLSVAGFPRPRIELVARDEQGQPRENLAPVAELSNLAGDWVRRVELLQESPSRYAARIELPPEVAEVVATARDSGSGAELARAALAIPFPEELARIGVNRAAIEELAAATGGRVMASPAELARMEFPRALGRGWHPAAPWLAAAALALVLAELAMRALRR